MENGTHLDADATEFGESPAFSAAKQKIVRELLAFTSLGSDEAGVVVLREDGTVYDFRTGRADHVASLIPPVEPVALFHTHSDPWAYSGQDWKNVLDHANVRDSFLVDPLGVHRIHRPDSDLTVLDYSPDEITELHSIHYLRVTVERQLRHEDVFSPAAEIQIWHEANRRLANSFGLKYRSEEHPR